MLCNSFSDDGSVNLNATTLQVFNVDARIDVYGDIFFHIFGLFFLILV